VGLVAEPCRSAVLKALAIARDAGVLRAYDTNLQLSLWGSAMEARYGLRLGLERADVIKLSLGELEFITGISDLVQAMNSIWSDGMRLMIVTLGAQGCAYRTATDSGQLTGSRVETVDTMRAGEVFLAGLLAELLAAGLSFEREAVERALRFANAASS
jgi:fructokinase